MQKNSGLAYDLSLFDTQTAEQITPLEEAGTYQENKVVRLHEHPERMQRKRRNPAQIFLVSLLMVVAAVIVSMILYNYVVLNEYNDRILTATKTITDQDNLKAQYELKISRCLPADMVQNYAEHKLNMTQANAAQKEFISLTEGDKGEVIRSEEKDSMLTSLKKIFHLG